MNTKVSIKQSRFYNFDLLKIILMYGIVIFHVVAGGEHILRNTVHCQL